jgi:hypothetical protein
MYLISPLEYKGLTQRIFLTITIITYIDFISIPLRKLKKISKIETKKLLNEHQ